MDIAATAETVGPHTAFPWFTKCHGQDRYGLVILRRVAHPVQHGKILQNPTKFLSIPSPLFPLSALEPAVGVSSALGALGCEPRSSLISW